MKFIGKFLVIVLVFSCSSETTTLDQYAIYPVKFGKQKVDSSKHNFSILIPTNWEWKFEDYDNENVLVGVNARSKPDQKGFVDIISIEKIKSFSNNKDLKSEYNYWLSLTKNKSDALKIVENGETKVLKQKSYFIHTKSNTGTYGEVELISFILNSEIKSVYYLLTASVSQTTDSDANMAVAIQSLKTFETN